MDDNEKYLALFFEETAEHLQSLNEHVLELENDPENTDILNEIFRSAHTMKGMSATMGYDAMTQLTHSLENIFDLLKSEQIKADSKTVTIVFECLDKITDIVEGIRNKSEEEIDIRDLIEKLTDISDNAKNNPLVEESVSERQDEKKDPLALNSILQKIEETDRNVIRTGKIKKYEAYAIAVKLEDDSMMKSARVFLITNLLDQHGDILITEPVTEVLETEDFGSIFKFILLTQLDESTIERMILNSNEVEEVVIQVINEDSRNESAADKSTEVMESYKPQNATKTRGQAKNNKTAKPETKTSKTPPMTQSIRVDLEKLDSFMNLVSELLIYRTRLEDISLYHQTAEMKEPLEHVSRITTELQDLVLKIRMQPVSTIMSTFPRMVRDLGNELDKEFDLVIEGEDTELDRTVVSELGEPLIHLIRNATDHGIEMPEERVALGKDRKGTIKIIAYQEGDRVALTISDDGKGIDPEVIKKSAEKKGIDAEDLSKRELQQLIFHPGFSTAESITNISGRGVGMDVVKQKITTLGGTIDLISEVHKGTTFKINLPLTLSIIHALIIKVSEQTFALPLGVIKRIIKPEEEDIRQTYTSEVYQYNGKSVPVIRLNRSLELPHSEQSNIHLIIVELGEETYALAADDLVRQQEIVIKKLGKNLSNLNKYLGATILGNGEIILILDVGAICHESAGEAVEQ